MSEDLFRLCVIRLPLPLDPDFPVIDLSNDKSEFQISLQNLVIETQGDLRSALVRACQGFLNDDHKAAPLNDDDHFNVQLDTAATCFTKPDGSLQERSKVVSALIAVFSTEGLPQIEQQGNGRKTPPQGEQTTEKERQAAKEKVLRDAITKFVSRLKDTIIALRLLGLEKSNGDLAKLAKRLRVACASYRLLEDERFPTTRLELDKYHSSILLAPSIPVLKPIFSTASERASAADKKTGALKDAQERIRRLWAERLMLTSALKDLANLSPEHRTSIEPNSIESSTSNEGLTQFKLTNQHLELIKDLSKLTVASFEKDMNTRVVMDGSRKDEMVTADTSALGQPSTRSTLVGMSKTLLDSLSQMPVQPPALPAWDAKQRITPFMLQVSAPLSSNTKTLLDSLNVNVFAKPIDSIAQDVRAQLSRNAFELDTAFAPYRRSVQRLQQISGAMVQYLSPLSDSWSYIFNRGDQEAPRLDMPSSAILQVPQGRVTILGEADLLIVKQQLKRYEGGDVAYIENVLAGETRSHEVNTLTSTRTEVVAEGETTESDETETSTAERFEVSSESEKIIKESISAEAGLTVSASYGPTVSVSANASFVYDRDKNDTKKRAENYAKDITTKATSKIAKRVLQRTTTTTRTETRTKDLHSFKNTEAQGHHISGVYQWMNKVYEAQMWNYGKRTILDFMIPEPGAFYLDKQSSPQGASTAITAVPAFDAEPSSLDAEMAAKLGAMYGMTELDPPPQEFSRASATYAPGEKETHAKADKIVLDTGYQVTSISISVSGVRKYDGSNVVVVCGNATFRWDPAKEFAGRFAMPYFGGIVSPAVYSQSHVSESRKQQAEIAWSVVGSGMSYFAVTIELLLQATNEAKRNWQNTTWVKLRAAADRRIAEQQAAIDNARFNSAFQGRNPEKNKTFIRNEMKKNCISILTDSHFDEIAANNLVQLSVTKAQDGLTISEINLEAAQLRGPYVRFFEEAFEWEEMTWKLFPYFWGRKDRWYSRVDYEDDDIEFEQFVQAGFARANVPVRPSFGGAVAHYLETGTIWMGGPLPGIGTETYLPLVTEIQEGMGKKDDKPTPYGEPWTVKVPTSLAQLRLDDQTPLWKKNENTGDWEEQRNVANAK